MSCKSPLLGYPCGYTDKGKVKYKIIPKLASYHDVPQEMRPIEIPCGKCIGCRLEYSRQWANRCMLELQYHESSYFITLTYDDAHVPYAVDSETGEILENQTLVKKHMQDFMKRLRFKFSDQKIRFYGCGEYGDTTKRPHYHIILFGLYLDDLQFYRRSDRGDNYYNSASLDDVWQKGFAVVAQVTWETCAYTARYVTKKLGGNMAEYYKTFKIQPEFVLMSRKPGIGRQYYEDRKDLYDYEYINVKTEKGGKKFRPPRYFDKLLEADNPERLQEIKAKRVKMAQASGAAKMSATTLDELELLAVEERNQQSKIKSLRRKL